MMLRVKRQRQQIHVHCTFYSSDRTLGTYALNGTLVFSYEEWRAFRNSLDPYFVSEANGETTFNLDAVPEGRTI